MSRWLMIRGVAFSVLVMSLVLSSAASAGLPPGGTFVDDNGNFHEPMIEAIAAEGLTNGCATNPSRYCPGDVVTRAEMAKFVVVAAGEEGNLPTYQGYFVDVAEGQWYTPWVERLWELGLTNGCKTSPLRFCPDGTLDRSEMAKFLVTFVEGDTNLPPYQGTFADVPSGQWYTAYAERLFQLGITTGCLSGPLRYCPNDVVLRDQMASFLGRTLGLDPIVPPPPNPGGGTFTVEFVAVRQGDAAVFVGACGDTGVIDANRFRSAEVLTAIDSIGTRNLKWIANTHYDADHLGAVLDVATASGVTVGQFYDRGGDRTVKDSNTYRDYFDYVTSAGTRTSLDIGGTFTLCTGTDQVTFTVVSAGTDGTAAGGVAVTEENDRGLCFLVEYHDFDLATCSDINGTDSGSRTDVESAVAASIGDVEVAKANHHGSTFSSNTTYVSTLSAEVSVISVGKNSFGHPDATVVSRWDTYGDVFQTQSPTDNALIDGNIVVTTSGVTSYDVTASASARAITRPMDEATP